VDAPVTGSELLLRAVIASAQPAEKENGEKKASPPLKEREQEEARFKDSKI
jgi:hypothetical protein